MSTYKSRLQEIADEDKSPYFQAVARGVITHLDELHAEITKLREELAAMTAQADAEAMYSDGMRAELTEERELADRLARQVMAVWPKRDNDPESIYDWRTRRNK